jgi:hypothetical protein
METPSDVGKFGKNNLKSEASEKKRKLYVVLEGANLEPIKFGDEYQLLNCDDHSKDLTI